VEVRVQRGRLGGEADLQVLRHDRMDKDAEPETDSKATRDEHQKSSPNGLRAGLQACTEF
jgi:hypothetical protein